VHLLTLVFFNRYTYFCVSYIIVISDRIGHTLFKMRVFMIDTGSNLCALYVLSYICMFINSDFKDLNIVVL